MNKWKIKKILSGPILKLIMGTKVRFNNKYEIPFIFGLSKDGRVIYFDKDFPRFFRYRGKTLDNYDLLKASELMRLTLTNVYNLDSETINDLVGDFENETVKKKLGIRSDVYAKVCLSRYSRPYGNDTLVKLPPDIDLIDLNLDESDRNKMVRFKHEHDTNRLLTNPHREYKIKKKERSSHARNLYKSKLSGL